MARKRRPKAKQGIGTVKSDGVKAEAKPGDAKARSGSGDAAETESDEPEVEASLAKRAWDQVAPLLVAVVLALGIRAVVVESYYVPSESMLPTLLIGDHVFVNKFVYGARVPFSDIHLPAVRDPERGEIVVFALGRRVTQAGKHEICPLHRCPDYPSEGFIKRVVGLPGDVVEYRGNVLYLNGEPAAKHVTGREMRDERGLSFPILEQDLEQCRHEILGDHPRLPGLTRAPLRVPEGEYFMLGDNRDNSNDSRAWGTVRREDLRGPAFFMYWSWNNQESWAAMLNPLTWLRLLWGETRWERFGMGLDCEPL